MPLYIRFEIYFLVLICEEQAHVLKNLQCLFQALEHCLAFDFLHQTIII